MKKVSSTVKTMSNTAKALLINLRGKFICWGMKILVLKSLLRKKQTLKTKSKSLTESAKKLTNKNTKPSAGLRKSDINCKISC